MYKYNGVSSRARKNGWDRQKIGEFSKAFLDQMVDKAGKDSMIKLISDTCMVTSLGNCVADQVADKVKYDPKFVKDIDNVPEDIKGPIMLHCIPDCLGQKGKWNVKFKELFVKEIMKKKVPEKLANCIVDEMEKDMSPVDVFNSVKDGSIVSITKKYSSKCQN